jgi:hypothetical protein
MSEDGVGEKVWKRQEIIEGCREHPSWVDQIEAEIRVRVYRKTTYEIVGEISQSLKQDEEGTYDIDLEDWNLDKGKAGGRTLSEFELGAMSHLITKVASLVPGWDKELNREL